MPLSPVLEVSDEQGVDRRPAQGTHQWYRLSRRLLGDNNGKAGTQLTDQPYQGGGALLGEAVAGQMGGGIGDRFGEGCPCREIAGLRTVVTSGRTTEGQHLDALQAASAQPRSSP